MQILWREVSRVNAVLIAFSFLLFLSACEEYQKGCMDVDAVNFKVSNQAPCCCEYPVIQFQTVLTDGESTLAFADTFMNQFGQKYTIRSFQFIASEISLTDSTDQVFKPTDTLHKYVISPGVVAVDVLNLNSSGANFLKNGKFERLSFQIDEVEELNRFRPADFPVDHPFRDSTFYSFQTQKWVLAKAILSLEDGTLLPLLLYNTEIIDPVDISGNWTKVRGKNLIVNFRVNVETLFSGMDFSQSTEQLEKEFISKLRLSIEP